MKPITEIIEMSEYKNHVFEAAMNEFACDPEDGPSMYYDSFTEAPIIYHLKNSKNLHSTKDEICIMEIPAFLDSLMNLDKKIYESMMSIYNDFIKIANEFDYDANHAKFKTFEAYGAANYSEMWANQEFKEQFDKDRNTIASRLRPINQAINDI